jgi:endonuclease VIII
MPEGDTVFRLARRLRAALDGRTVRFGQLRGGAAAGRDLSGRVIVEHETYGKHLLTRFDDGTTLHTHLRMSGSWTVTRAGRRLPRRLLPDVRVLLGTTEGTTAYGILLPVVELLATRDERAVVGHLGPDPLRADWDPARAAELLRADPDVPVAAALLDQRRIAGLGNLWANELCFLRGLDPWTPVRLVDVDPLVALAARALRTSATGAMQVTTGDPRRGNEHWVAGRAHQPCRRCGTPIRVVAEERGPGGRRTWWCPHCQPAPRTAGV